MKRRLLTLAASLLLGVSSSQAIPATLYEDTATTLRFGIRGPLDWGDLGDTSLPITGGHVLFQFSEMGTGGIGGWLSITVSRSPDPGQVDSLGLIVVDFPFPDPQPGHFVSYQHVSGELPTVIERPNAFPENASYYSWDFSYTRSAVVPDSGGTLAMLLSALMLVGVNRRRHGCGPV